jgi:hypothetical protein
MQMQAILESKKQSQEQVQQHVSSGVLRYFYKHRDWLTPYSDFSKWQTLTNWQLSLNCLRAHLNALTEKGSLVSARAKSLSPELVIKKPDGTLTLPVSSRANQISHYIPSVGLLQSSPLIIPDKTLTTWAIAEVARIEKALSDEEVRTTLQTTSVPPDKKRQSFITATAQRLETRLNNRYNFQSSVYRFVVEESLKAARGEHPHDQTSLVEFLGACIDRLNVISKSDSQEGFRTPSFIR